MAGIFAGAVSEVMVMWADCGAVMATGADCVVVRLTGPVFGSLIVTWALLRVVLLMVSVKDNVCGNGDVQIAL